MIMDGVEECINKSEGGKIQGRNKYVNQNLTLVLVLVPSIEINSYTSKPFGRKEQFERIYKIDVDHGYYWRELKRTNVLFVGKSKRRKLQFRYASQKIKTMSPYRVFSYYTSMQLTSVFNLESD